MNPTSFLTQTLQPISELVLIAVVLFFCLKYAYRVQEAKRIKKAAEIGPKLKTGQTIKYRCDRTDRIRFGYIVSITHAKSYCTVRISRSHLLDSVDFHNIKHIVEP